MLDRLGLNPGCWPVMPGPVRMLLFLSVRVTRPLVPCPKLGLAGKLPTSTAFTKEHGLVEPCPISGCHCLGESVQIQAQLWEPTRECC
jgi:hypothetical protein